MPQAPIRVWAGLFRLLRRPGFVVGRGRHDLAGHRSQAPSDLNAQAMPLLRVLLEKMSPKLVGYAVW